jgi:4-diphosphocytidyl-2-C-methyl-D-erythritol kinase
LLSFPNCKINLGLRILDKRPDGYHNLQTIFFPVPLFDALEIIANSGGEQDVIFTASGLAVNTAEQDNLCVKAYRLLKKDFPKLPPVRIHLHKTIPMGAGLGGGSSDGAFTLSRLNSLFRLGLSSEQLGSYALQLGSDCPFFIVNKPSIGGGRGEYLLPVELTLSGCSLVLINPGIHVDTGWAFRQLAEIRSGQKAETIALHRVPLLPLDEWKHLLTNDFEEPVFARYPEIAEIKHELYRRGALYASMSGSGSTVFGFFENLAEAVSGWPPTWFVRRLPL